MRKRGYHRHDPAADTKRCGRCGVVKQKSEFHRTKRRAHLDGLHGHCKECRRSDHDANRDREVARMQAYHEEHRERENDRSKAYAKNNHDRILSIRAARRARKKQATIVEDVDRAEVLRRSDGVCGICGDPVDSSDFHVDHIVPLSKNGDHSYANTQPAHPLCNLRKKNKMPELAA